MTRLASVKRPDGRWTPALILRSVAATHYDGKKVRPMVIAAGNPTWYFQKGVHVMFLESGDTTFLANETYGKWWKLLDRSKNPL